MPERKGRGFELLLLALMTVAAVASIPFWWKGNSTQTIVVEQRERQVAASMPVQTTSATPITISIVSSNTKETWLHAQAIQFQNDSSRSEEWQANGHPIRVTILQETIDGKKVDYRSGTMVAHIVAEKIQPTIASPGEPSWTKKLNKEWRAMHNSPIVKKDALLVVRTPVVLAMWQSRAQALGCWPEVKEGCSWERLSALAVDKNGWGGAGHPEWGPLKLGYGYFGESNSGTLGIVAMCMAGTKKTTGLQMQDVSVESECGKVIERIEQAKVHSGKSDIWLLERMVAGGPEYLDGVITYESNVIRANQKSDDLREPLVSVYPSKRTIVVGHPFAILDGASWVSGEQIAAAEIFRRYLLRGEAQKEVLALGMRGADPQAPLLSPIELAYGANPATKLTEVELPDAVVIDQIEAVWHKLKKRAFVALVFDKSGSMRGQKMAAAVKGAQAFVGAMELPDTLLWLPFDGIVYGNLMRGTKREIGERLTQDIAGTLASGDTALYDAVKMAHQTLSDYRKANGNNARYGIVILSDGEDTKSKITLPELESILAPSEGDPHGVQIHTICIGSDCVEKVLMRIATAAHGKYWKGNTPAEMISVYQGIATHY